MSDDGIQAEAAALSEATLLLVADAMRWATGLLTAHDVLGRAQSFLDGGIEPARLIAALAGFGGRERLDASVGKGFTTSHAIAAFDREAREGIAHEWAKTLPDDPRSLTGEDTP